MKGPGMRANGRAEHACSDLGCPVELSACAHWSWARSRRWCSIAAANLLRPCVGTQLLQLPSLCCHLPLPLPLRPVPRTPSSAPNLETSWPAKACSPDGLLAPKRRSGHGNCDLLPPSS